ncbi:hypothetical protein HYX13_03870 [Candidatus Woesearchaeota archaeon]|nr:hypothetical protein [Candidatus Woesearchaeota archaeon]
MNEITRYFEQNTKLAGSIDQYAHPLDALNRINPELASLALANKEQWLTPEVLPAIALFRKMQRDEKIATLNAIVNTLGIESEERKHGVSMHTAENLGRMRYDVDKQRIESDERKQGVSVHAQTQMVNLQETELTERTEIMANNALELQKVKYEANVEIVKQEMSERRYLSDNELKAIHIENQALKDMIIFTEQIRADTQRRGMDARLKEKVAIAEYHYLTKIKEAEELRNICESQNNAAITQTNLMLQAKIMREALLAAVQQDSNRVSLVERYITEKGKLIVAKIQAATFSEQTANKTLEAMTKECAEVLKTTDAKSVNVTYKGQDIFTIEVEK